MIKPEKVAEAILEAATHPTRARRVGALSVANTTTAKLAPSLADKMAAKQYNRLHHDGQPPRDREGSLYRPSEATGVVGASHGVAAGA